MLKDQLASLEADLVEAQNSMQREGQRLPNLAHPEASDLGLPTLLAHAQACTTSLVCSVLCALHASTGVDFMKPSSLQAPIGGEEDARVVELVGSKPGLTSGIRDHLQLGKELDLLDFEAAAVTSGSKFAYLKRAAALLELALCNWAMVQLHRRGFVPVSTPDLVQAAVLEKCGFQPRGSNTQVLHATCLPTTSCPLMSGCRLAPWCHVAATRGSLKPSPNAGAWAAAVSPASGLAGVRSPGLHTVPDWDS